MRGGRFLGVSLLFASAVSLVGLSPAAATTSAHPRVRIGKTPRIPTGAASRTALATNTQLHVDVTLAPRNPEQLAEFAEAVSTPRSGLYRRYITPSQFADFFGPTSSAIQSVKQALTDAGLHPGAVSANHLSIPVAATAGQLSAAFSTGFDQYVLPSGRVAYANTSAPQIAASAAAYVQGVVGLDDLNLPTPVGASSRAGATSVSVRPPAGRAAGGAQACSQQATAASANGAYTADEVGSAYGFPNLYNAGDLGAGQTVAVYELQGYNTNDISAYDACFGVTTPVTAVNTDGGPVGNSGVGEADIDIETISTLAPDISILDYQAPNTASGWLDQWNTIVTQDAAKVVSVSWGQCENYDGAQAQSENTIFEEAAAQGQTIVASAGDQGSEDCYTAQNHAISSLSVDDPAGQPYITGVGGTQWTAFGTPPTEKVWNVGPTTAGFGGGGGGVSALWTMPSYQANAAPSVGTINTGSSGVPCGAVSGYCREAPDVSALAGPYPYWMYSSGVWDAWGGTSLGAPVWAALIALTNASSACAGATVGFANPLLYGVAGTDPSAFNDVVVGNNDLTGGHGGTYPALTGYDMASGLGTPNGATLPAALCAADTTPDPVTMTNPGPQSSVLFQPMTLQIAASDATNGQTLTYSAIGLPDGIRIDPATGLISGYAADANVWHTVIFARDANGASAAVTFAWSVPLSVVVAAVKPTYGPGSGGTVVQLRGLGFAGATEVIFGAVTYHVGSFVEKAGDVITFTTPPGVGTVAIQVVGQLGTSPVTTASMFSYLPVITKVTPLGGPATGGTKVNIAGKNLSGLSGPSAVMFGATPATSYTVNAAGTLITAYSPAENAGTVDIVVTTAGGTTTNTAADHYIYYGPIITSVSPVTGPVAGGTKVTIKGKYFTGLSGPSAVMFGATPAKSYTVNAAGTVIKASAPAESVGSVDIVVTSPVGSSTTSAADQFTFA